MIAVISPAKTLDFDNAFPVDSVSEALFLTKSQTLVNKLKKLNAKKIATLMDVSENIAELNYTRFQNFNLPFTPENAKAAISVFRGDVYIGMQAETFSRIELDYAQDHLRILSGLYGLLAPKDLIQAYRLEMGSSFAPSPSKKNLYQFWGDSLSDSLNKACQNSNSEVLVNLASQEYFKAVNTKKLKVKLHHCEFKDSKNGQYKIISFFAKKARGMMANYIIKNQISRIADLKGFDYEGYRFNQEFSNPTQYTFTREENQ